MGIRNIDFDEIIRVATAASFAQQEGHDALVSLAVDRIQSEIGGPEPAWFGEPCDLAPDRAATDYGRRTWRVMGEGSSGGGREAILRWAVSGTRGARYLGPVARSRAAEVLRRFYS